METNMVTNIARQVQKVELSFQKTEHKVEQRVILPQTNQIKKEEIRVIKSEEFARAMQEMLDRMNLLRSVKINYDKSVNRLIIKIVEGETEKVIRQIPPEGIVRFLKAFNDMMGMIIDEKV